jgi:hypothetical protein
MWKNDRGLKPRRTIRLKNDRSCCGAPEQGGWQTGVWCGFDCSAIGGPDRGFAAGPIIGQDSTYRSVAVVTGRPARLSLHFNLNKDCSPAGPPEIRVIAPPRHGTLSIRSGTARAERVTNCEKVQTPVRLVLYASGLHRGRPSHV